MNPLRVERLQAPLPILFALLVVLWTVPPGIYPLGALAATALLAALGAALLMNPRLQATSERNLLLVLLIPLALSFPQALDRGEAVDRLVLMGGALLVFAASRRLRADEARGVLLLLVSAGALLALHGFWQYLDGLPRMLQEVAAGSPEAARLSSLRIFARFVLPSVFASFLLLAAPVALGLARAGRGWRRLLPAAAAAAMGLALLLTRSHGAFAALLAMVFLWSLTAARRRSRWTLTALAVALLGFLVVIWSRDGVVTAGLDGPAVLRWRNFQTAVAMFLDRPVAGSGGGGYGAAYPAYRLPGDNETRFVHNSYLQLLVEHGLTILLPLGAVLMVWGRAVRRAARAAPPPLAGVAFGLGAFLLHNLVDFSGLLPATLWTACALAGLLVGQLDAGGLPGQAVPGRSDTRLKTLSWVAPLVLACGFGMFAALSRDAVARGQQFILDESPGEALAAAREAGEWAPWRAAPYLLEAEILLHNRDLEGEESAWNAYRAASMALQRAPVWPAAHAVRAVAAAALDTPGLAAADLQRAADLYPLARGYRRQLDVLARRLDEHGEGQP
ncbi:MAG: O-antigen ligase domain-containing protein [Acidobacteria bacterium]|nr:MAG: O-antigen ligase domain-containing protein [Acidobacteriota bacterium]